VPIAAKVAAALNAPLDLILVRKMGVPYRRELAMGAVVDGDEPLDVIGFAGIDESEFNAVCDSELAEIERRRQRYLGSRERVEVAGRTAIVIDDGIATSATTRAALRATRRQTSTASTAGQYAVRTLRRTKPVGVVPRTGLVQCSKLHGRGRDASYHMETLNLVPEKSST
jgi:phosphoribosylpyrophosphate synthetase